MRVISAQALAALDSGRFLVRALLKVSPADVDPFCVWDDIGSITYSGDTYVGKAGRFTISPVQNSQDLAARSVDVVFAGIDQSVVNQFLTAPWHQAPVTIMRAIVATDVPQVLHVTTEFAGFVDQMLSQDRAGGTTTLTYRCESSAREFQRAGARTRSDTDQRERDEDDEFYAFSASAITEPINWGGSPQHAGARQKQGGLAGLMDKLF